MQSPTPSQSPRSIPFEFDFSSSCEDTPNPFIHSSLGLDFTPRPTINSAESTHFDFDNWIHNSPASTRAKIMLPVEQVACQPRVDQVFALEEQERESSASIGQQSHSHTPISSDHQVELPGPQYIPPVYPHHHHAQHQHLPQILSYPEFHQAHPNIHYQALGSQYRIQGQSTVSHQAHDHGQVEHESHTGLEQCDNGMAEISLSSTQPLSSPTSGAAHGMATMDISGDKQFAYQPPAAPIDIASVPARLYQSMGHPMYQPDPRYAPYRYLTQFLTSDGPISPPLSLSPPGSAGSHLHHNLSPSSNLASPFSGMSSAPSLPDLSPQTGLSYPLPNIGTPLNSIHHFGSVSPVAPGPGPNSGTATSMGFTFPAQHLTWGMGMQPATRGGTRGTGRGRARGGRGRSRGGRTMISPAPARRSEVMGGEEDKLADDDSLGEAAVGPDGPVVVKREDLRRNRVDSEQVSGGPTPAELLQSGADKSKRRRDELRCSFDGLREVLPPSKRKVSKTTVLEQAVDFIHRINAERDEWQMRYEAKEEENLQLRSQISSLIHAFESTQAGSGSTSTTGPPL